MAISIEQIKNLRERTGAGVVDAKQALEGSGGEIEKAILWLREKGKVTAAKKAMRETKEGFIGSYVHSNGKIAAFVSLTCETDFVARNQKFRDLARNIAMHIAAMDPLVVHPDDVSEEDVVSERNIAQKQMEGQNKPPQILEKIIEGKLKKFREEKALLTQPYVKEPNKTVEALIAEAILELGENIVVREFTRLEI